MDETKKIVTTDDIITKGGVLYDDIESPEGSLCLTKKVLTDSVKNVKVLNSLSNNQLVPEDCINVIEMGPFKIYMYYTNIISGETIQEFKLVQPTYYTRSTESKTTTSWSFFTIQTPYDSYTVEKENTTDNILGNIDNGSFHYNPDTRQSMIFRCLTNKNQAVFPNTYYETIPIIHGNEESAFDFHSNILVPGVAIYPGCYAVIKIGIKIGNNPTIRYGYYKLSLDEEESNLTTTDKTFHIYFKKETAIDSTEYGD